MRLTNQLLYLYRNTPGRPTIEVDIHEVEYLRSLRFSWTKIASILCISRSTLYRRLQDENISQDTQYSNITNLELDQKIKAIKEVYPNDGERMIIGHLLSSGLILQRARIRASIHRVDPINTALRRSITIRRRVYHVSGPNCVWHVDTNHKIIRWRIVIQGCIDGYSRTLIYLQCSNNNLAITNFTYFIDAVQKYGLPEKVRTDLGGENTDIWRYMVEEHNSNSAVVTGSSTHNTRIERMWRDVHRCVSVLFCDTFRQLEDEGRLDVLNEVDMFCLQFVFIQRINHALEVFAESWNNHPLSTEHNKTPNQLFIEGALQQQTLSTPSHGPPSNLPASRDHVMVPRSAFSPCSRLKHYLDQISVLRDSDSFGIDIFEEAVDTVGFHLVLGCQDCHQD